MIAFCLNEKLNAWVCYKVANGNAKFFDLYTFGADGVLGGNDKNEDIGNWD
jgi:hypothetical protein